MLPASVIVLLYATFRPYFHYIVKKFQYYLENMKIKSKSVENVILSAIIIAFSLNIDTYLSDLDIFINI